jgi:acyl-CoA thioester hydrolase
MRAIEFHDTTVRVRYAETDQMGVVYHSNYLIWFEVGRIELMRALGFEYKTMEKADDCFIVVAEAHCRYEKPARYDEVLRVRTRIAEWRNRIVKFDYEIFRDAGGDAPATPAPTLLATGYTTHVICGSNGRPKALPAKYRDVLHHLNVPNPDRSNA